jgi:hypothetical protein
MNLEDIIRELGVVINKASYAKKDAQRHLYNEHEGTKQDRIDDLSESLSDASIELDSIKDSLYELVELLENEKYRQELEELSPYSKEKNDD